MAQPCRAVVTYRPQESGAANFILQELSIRDIRDDECLVEIIASGICHSDIAFATRPDGIYPRVLGHEGK